MKIIVDSSSLISLVRYYLPFDVNNILYNSVQDKIKSGQIILIDRVLDECKYMSKGVVLTSLSFLSDNNFRKQARIPVKTDSIIAPSPAKFLRRIDNELVQAPLRNLKRLSETEYENEKRRFLEGADTKQIILCLNLMEESEDVYIVTEETKTDNDNKLFKKLPAICSLLGINTFTLPQLLAKFDDIQIIIALKN